MPEQLPTVFGNYVLLELIARGGMAEVYLAKMKSAIDGFEKRVALKRILPNLSEDDDFITMLIDEARISVSLNHSNIAQVYDLGNVDGTYYIAMEYINGIDLSSILKTLTKKGYLIPLEHALFITKGLAAGLYCAHSRTDEDGNNLGIVHRDVSPHNLLISFDGDVKIIDFGVAKASVKSGQTRMGVIKGKLLYMAPEQAMAKNIDARADQFAIGLCLYKMITGRLPFEADNEFQIYNNILHGEIAPPKTINPQTPDIVNELVMRSLQRNADDRFKDCWEMHQALERAMHELYPGYSQARLSSFLDEYFADAKRKKNTSAKAISASYPNQQNTSHPSHPSRPSYPNTPSHSNQSTPNRAQVPVQAQRNAPNIPRPEDLGFVSSAGPGADGGDKTLDMSLDPADLARLKAAMPAGFNGDDAAPTINMSVSSDLARQAAQLNAPPSNATVPLPSVRPPQQPQRPPRPHQQQPSSKVPLILAIVFILMLAGVGAFLYFFVFAQDTGQNNNATNTPPTAQTSPSEDPNTPTKDETKTLTPNELQKALKGIHPLVEKAIDKAGGKFRADVFISITTQPKGAEVYQDNTLLGNTPLKFKTPRSNRPVQYTVKLKDYQDKVIDIRPDNDRNQAMMLDRK